MVVRLALLRTVIDVPENTETEFRILVEDFPFGAIIGQVLGHETRISAGAADKFADLLAAFRPRIGGKDAVSFLRKSRSCTP